MAAKSTEVEAPEFPPAQHQQGQKKRPASDGLENEQRLSKRFDLLNLGKQLPILPPVPRMRSYP